MGQEGNSAVFACPHLCQPCSVSSESQQHCWVCAQQHCAALPAQLHLQQEHVPSFEKKQALVFDLFGCFHLHLSKVKEKVHKA